MPSQALDDLAGIVGILAGSGAPPRVTTAFRRSRISLDAPSGSRHGVIPQVFGFHVKGNRFRRAVILFCRAPVGL